jgi:endonuclease YncB( thermonuclease family)
MILTCALALISITDGDTFRCGETRIRIANIDAPDSRTCPDQAADAEFFLRAILQHGTLTYEPLYLDRYGRTVAHVWIDSTNVADLLVHLDHAQPWPHSAAGRALTDRPRGC